MNNPTETSEVVNPHFYEIFRDHMSNDFLENLIEKIISNDVWTKQEAAIKDFGFVSMPRAVAKQRIYTSITDVVQPFWDKARDLERQGYTISEFKMQIQFKSIVAQTEITCDITASEAAESTMDVIQTDVTDIQPEITETTTSFRPEDMPFIINDVRNGNIPSDLPRIVVTKILEVLAKNPHWTGDDVDKMSTTVSEIDGCLLTTKLDLLYSQPALLDTNETNSMDLIVSQPSITEQALSAVPKTQSYSRTVAHGLSRNSIFMQFKPVISSVSDVQRSLQSLSMSGAGEDA